MTEVLLLSFGSLWLLWALYVFVMGVYRLHLKKELKGINFVLAWPIVIVGVILDAVINITLASIIFLDIPREWLTTARLHRYIENEAGWRTKIAKYICDNILDIFDPKGNHC